MSPLRYHAGTFARLFALLAGVIAVVAVTTAATPDSGGDEFPMTFIFSDASPLVTGNVVKAAGVDVGKVEAVELKNGKAQVRALVEKAVLPLHTDAHATITTKDILGEEYISLQRGSPNAPLATDPIVIPESQTSRVVNPEDVLNSLDTPTSTDLAAFITTSGEGLRGQGPEAAAAIKALAPAMRHTAALSRILSQQNQVLTSLVDTTQPVAAELAEHRGHDLDQLVGSAERTLSAVSANRQAVDDALQRLPGTLQSARATLNHVAGVADSATPTLQSIRPTTDNLLDIDRELREFSDAADPALDSLDPVLDRAKKLIDEAAPVVDDLRSFGPDFRSVAGSARDISEKGVSLRFRNLMEFAKDWSLSTTGYDALSHYFRASVPLTPLAEGRNAVGAIPGAPDSPLPGSPLSTPPRLTLPGNCPEPNHTCENEHFGGGPGIKRSPIPDGPTGLTPQQENSMLDQVLGGR
jgi:phospholipid/cholesterol/gamma-HCH transport system substrate-binding protein